MKLTSEQRGVVIASAIAIALTAASLICAYHWLAPGWVGAVPPMSVADRIAYALKWNLPMLLWLAGCVRAVSSGRFSSQSDIAGAAYGPPSPVIAVQVAVLQNSLEQTVLAFAANLILATLLEACELVLLPILVGLFLIGRISFAWAYPKGAAARAFGMSLTGAAFIASLGMSLFFLAAGR
jgi:hypothetical protein